MSTSFGKSESVVAEWRKFVDNANPADEIDSLECSRIAGQILVASRRLQRTLPIDDPRADRARAAEAATLAAERLGIEVLGAQLSDDAERASALSVESYESLVEAGQQLSLALEADSSPSSSLADDSIPLTTAIPDLDLTFDTASP